MFTARTLKGLEIFFRIHNFTIAGPFKWNKFDGTITTHSTKLSQTLLRVCHSWMVIVAIWSTITFFHQVTEDGPLKSSVLNCLFFQWKTGIVVYNFNMVMHMREIKEFVNCVCCRSIAKLLVSTFFKLPLNLNS